MKTTRRFDFNYKPLITSVSLTVESTVPDKQTYDVGTGTYTPDYTLTPLTLRANCSIMDLDGILDSGDVNKDLANIKWYQTTNGATETLVDPEGADGLFPGQEGQATAGEITVWRNISPSSPLTLRFVAEYIDPRTGQIHKFSASALIRCSAEAATPVLEIDSPAQVIYNPIRHKPIQQVVASLRLAGSEVPATHRAFVWQILRENGTWSDVGEEVTDYDVEISADGTTATVDRSLMAEDLTLRVAALYDPDGNPTAKAITETTPIKTVTFKRRYPEYWEEILDCPYNIPFTPYIFPKAEVRDTIAILTDDELNEYFTVDWYMATNKPNGATLTYTKLAEGISPQIATSLMSQTIGGVLALDVKEREPLKALADSDGKVLTDSDGAILLIQ